ncbi:MAG: outer membrane beta-barrel protein [Ramlibacter sp.]|nr:outer membrane beta-barrel protein [Ramlibacter sp.]
MKTMKPVPHAFLLSALAAALTCATAGAAAAQPGYYIGLHGGTNNLDSWPATVTLGPGVSLPGSLSLDSGTHFGLMAGRQTENARFEIEAQSGKFDITGIQLGLLQQNVSAGGRYKAFTFNAYRTQALSERLTGYAGLGIGWGSASLPQLGFASGCNCFPAASETGLAYLGRVGLEYRFGDQHHAFAQYTQLRLPRMDSGGTPAAQYARKGVGIAGVGYRFTF